MGWRIKDEIVRVIGFIVFVYEARKLRLWLNESEIIPIRVTKIAGPPTELSFLQHMYTVKTWNLFFGELEGVLEI